MEQQQQQQYLDDPLVAENQRLTAELADEIQHRQTLTRTLRAVLADNENLFLALQIFRNNGGKHE